MEPMAYPAPRDLRAQLQRAMCNRYKDTKVSKIPLSTEIILKTLKFKDPEKPEKPLLKYKVINNDWDLLQDLNDTFDSRMFAWIKEDQEFSIIDND